MELGKIGTLGVSGSYRYYSSPRPDHQEKLKLHISGQHVAFIALGWAIRRLFCVKDNYFGGFTQFSTMQEFLEKFDHSPDSVGDPVMEKYRPGRSDSFAVRLTVDVTDSLVLMSDQIYDAKHGIAIPVPQLQLDLKTNEFQMDMTLDVAPTYAIACPSIASSYKEVAAPLARSQDVVFVEGIFIKANRLFGPQPRATTYFCLWELSFMRISAFLSPEFKTTLAAVGAAVGYNYSDYDNAPASIYIAKTPPDATFVKLSVDHVTALLSSGLDGVAVELPDGLFIDTSSVASQSCGSVLGFGIPTVTAHVLHRKSPSKPWKPVGVLGTGVSIDIFRIPEGWEEESRQQNAFLKEQDAPTRRIAYLYGGKDGPQIGQHVHQIYVPHPKLADASWQDGTSVYTSGSRRLEPGPSSPDQSDDSRPSIPLSRMSRKTTSLSLVAPSMAVPPEYSDDNSLGDESDSVSSVDSFSSHSSHESEQDNIHMEASAVLEERLKAFRDIYQRADKTFTRERSLLVPPEEEAEREKPYDGVTINNGSIFRIVVEQTSVDLNPQTVQSAHALVGAMNRVIPSNGIIMDQLLKVQVSAVRKRNVRPSASLYDIDLPMADVRLVLGSFTTPEAIVQLLVQGASSRIVNDPASASFDPNTPKPKMNVALSIQDLRAVGGRNERQSASVSLSDVLDIPLDPRYHQIVPDCYLLAHHLDVTFHSTEADKTVQAKFGSVNVHSATYAMPAILGFIDSWKDVATSLPEQPCSHPQAHLICAILLGLTGAADLPIPEFAQEASYGLHVDDIRNIRRDLGWFTLTRLRECMGHTEIDCKPGPPLPDMARLVVEELARLDAPMGVTEELVLTEPFLKKAFGQNFDELIPDKHPTRSMSLFVGVESLSLRHYGHLLESNTVASSLVGLQSVTLLTRKTTCWAEDRPFINVNSAVKLQKCEVDLQTSIMAVIQALLTHFDTHRKEIRELEVVQVLDHASDIITSVQLGQVNLGAVAGGMRLDVILDKGDVSAALMKRRRPTDEFCMSQNQEETTANLSVVELKAALSQVPTMPPHSTAPSTDRPPDRPVITSAFRDVHGTLVKLDNHIDTDIDTTKILLGVEAVTFESRPLPRAFYEFGRAWRNEHYPLYKPTVDQFKVVMDRRRTPLSTPTPSVAPRCEIIRGRDLALDLCIKSMDFQARLAKTLRLGWETGKLYATRSGTDDYVQFGLLVDPQTLGLYPNSKRTKKGSSVLRLPSIKVKGLYANSNDRRNMTADVRFGLFTGNIKPTVLDRLLLVHQQVGSDIVEAVSEYSSERTPSPVVITKPKKDPLLFNINASFEGIRVGLRADDVATTLLFEALNLELQTSVDNAVRSNLEWSLTANPVSLSLIRLEDDLDHGTKPARGTRFMSMTCDVTARETAATETHPGKLNMRLARVHALMHLAALSEASELIRSWSSEITVLREVHRAEMEEVKAQTSKVLKKIDAARSSSKTSVVASSADPITPSTDLTIVTDFKNPSLETWLSARQIKFQIHDLGIAIPLGTASPIDVGWHESHKSSGPALLYSINDIALNTSRNETARFTVQQMSLAFVDAFDPLQERHFNVQVHKARNIMTLPNILAEAQRMSDTETWSVNLHCAATDFKLKLMPDVAEFMGQLADMYEDGKAQLSAMEREYAEWTKSAGTEDTTESVKTKYEQTGTPVPTATGKRLVVRMSFRFDSGVVQLRRVRQGPAPSALWRERQKLKKSKDFDEIVLPTVSVWLDYTGPGPDDEKIGTLLLNTAVHESKNTLQPTILLFTGEVISHLDERSEKKRLAAAAAAAYGRPALHAVAVSPKLSPALSTAKLSPRLSTRALPDTPSVSSFTDRAVERIAESPTGKLRVRVTLRIDSSKLRLSCANSLMETYLDLKWASGGFSVATLLGGHDPTTLVGTVSGVGAELSYDFKDRPHHITAATKDLAFTVTMTSGNSRSLSVVLDTELSIQFDLLALNAWLIFKAGWIDNAPKMASFATPAVPSTPQNPHMPHLPHLPHSHASNMSRASSSPHTPAIIVASPPRAKLGIAVLVRLRTVDFEAKLGVTTAQLKLWPIVVRTVSNGEMTTLEATIGKTQITAEGQIWGDVTSDGIKFKTVRRSSRATGTSDPTVLSIIIVAALLTGNMFIGDSNIVGFSLDPTTVSLKDNWRNYAPHDPNAEIGLDFVVNAGKFSGVLRLPMIPRLLSQFYTMLSVIESQTTMATKRSDALKERQQRTDAVGVKPATTVMIPQQDPVAHPNLIRTIQHMRLGIAEVNVGLFVDDYDDGTKADFFHFYVGKVKADLERREERPSSFPLRKLRLYVAKIVWQTSSGSAANRAEKELRAQLRTAPEPTATTTSPPSPSSPSPPHTGRQPTPLEIIAAANKTRPRDVAVLPGATITLDSTESTPPPILNYDFNIVWDAGAGDLKLLPNFYQLASNSIKRSAASIKEVRDAQQTMRTSEWDQKPSVPPVERAEDKDKDKEKEKEKDKEKGEDKEKDENKDKDKDKESPSSVIDDGKLKYVNRDPNQDPGRLIPRIRMLGDTTGDAAMLIPMIREAASNFGPYSHRFLTLPLEDAMNLLVKLYQRQMPDEMSDEMAGDGASPDTTPATPVTPGRVAPTAPAPEAVTPATSTTPAVAAATLTPTTPTTPANLAP
jgi:hypothetical protein